MLSIKTDADDNLNEKTEKESAKKSSAKEKIDNTEDVQKTLRAQKHVKIMIPSTETDRDPVVVSVNGYVYMIKRDASVEVPEAVVEALKNAILIQFAQKRREDGDGNELIPVAARRYAFQIE